MGGRRGLRRPAFTAPCPRVQLETIGLNDLAPDPETRPVRFDQVLLITVSGWRR